MAISKMKNERIERHYYLKNKRCRASLWTLWIDLKANGLYEIYFANKGYRKKGKETLGFSMHLSLHKDGNAHIKDFTNEKKKTHEFNFQINENFPICSVITNKEDINIPMHLRPYLQNEDIPIEHKWKNTINDWIELLFIHIVDNNPDDFLRKSYRNIRFEHKECIEIQPNRKIYLYIRTVKKPSIQKLADISHDPHSHSKLQRACIWSKSAHIKNHILIHDLPANKPIPWTEKFQPFI